MPTRYYPAILHPADRDGLFGVEIPGINVNGSGASADLSLADAAAILQEVIDDLHADGATVPEPVALDQVDAGAGRIVLLPAILPG